RDDNRDGRRDRRGPRSVMMRLVETPTGVRRELSTTGFAVVPAAAVPQRLEAVLRRQPELRRDGRVIGRPVREEVPDAVSREVGDLPHASMVGRAAVGVPSRTVGAPTWAHRGEGILVP